MWHVRFGHHWCPSQTTNVQKKKTGDKIRSNINIRTSIKGAKNKCLSDYFELLGSCQCQKFESNQERKKHTEEKLITNETCRRQLKVFWFISAFQKLIFLFDFCFNFIISMYYIRSMCKLPEITHHNTSPLSMTSLKLLCVKHD